MKKKNFHICVIYSAYTVFFWGGGQPLNYKWVTDFDDVSPEKKRTYIHTRSGFLVH